MIYIDLLVLLGLISLLSIWLDRRYIRHRKTKSGWPKAELTNLE